MRLWGGCGARFLMCFTLETEGFVMRCILCCFFVLLGFFILPQSSVSGDCIDYSGIGEEPPVPDPLAGELQFYVFQGSWDSSLATSNHLFVKYHFYDGTYPGAPDYFRIEIVPRLCSSAIAASTKGGYISSYS